MFPVIPGKFPGEFLVSKIPGNYPSLATCIDVVIGNSLAFPYLHSYQAISNGSSDHINGTIHNYMTNVNSNIHTNIKTKVRRIKGNCHPLNWPGLDISYCI